MQRTIELGDFRVNVDTYRASVQNREVRFTPMEFRLLLYLVKHAGRIVSKQKLIAAIWGENTEGQPERLRVLLRQVRKKMEALGRPEYILTEHWLGYRFEPSEQVKSPAREISLATKA